MDQKNNHSLTQCYRLLALCARAQPHANMDEQIKKFIHSFNAWDDLPQQAELHGMSALLWHHLQRLQISIPSETKKTLQGLYLRQRAHHQTHTQTLLHINSLLAEKNIQAVVLKGLALAYEYYPEPVTRPASDIDLLLEGDDILSALDILTQAGYKSSNTPQADLKLLPKELTLSSPPTNGLITRIELHHHNPHAKSAVDHSADDEFIGFDKPPHAIKIDAQMVYVPNPINHLDYVVRHLIRHMFVATNEKPLPLKWIADVICIVERHAQEINWDENKHLLNRLEVIYSLTPFPEHLSSVIPIQQIQAPSGVNQYPQGWPQQVYPQWKHKGILYYLTKTFLSPTYIWHTLSTPSAWWLMLQYGIKKENLFWYGQVVYRLQILRMAVSKVARN